MWRFAAAKATGTSHIRAQLPCQDEFVCELTEDQSLIAALADGAGSAALAKRGAELAVRTAISHLKQAIAEKRTDFACFLRESAIAARDAISADANQEGAALRSYACTLLVAVLCQNGGAALQIGDGVIVVSDGGSEWSWVFWPQRGEYVNTTNFLTDDAACDQMQVEAFSGLVTDIAVMSDGLESLAVIYRSKSVYDPFFRRLFKPLVESAGSAEIHEVSASLEQFLSSDQVRSRTDDDVSLILATRRMHEPNKS